MRQLYAGKICSDCSSMLPERTDGRSGERRCQRCADKLLHTVHMNFMEYQGRWHVSFLQADARTTMPWKGSFATQDALYQIVRRSHSSADAERDLENSLRSWARGTVTLRLNSTQYTALMKRNPRHH